MRIYDGAMLHITNKLKKAPGELGEVTSFDLGNIPEEVINKKVSPLIEQLMDILNEYRVYPWLTIGWHEENTDNEV